MNAVHYDMVILGTGPGGEGAAMQAAKSGKSVAVVESTRKSAASAPIAAPFPARRCALRFFR